MKTVPQIFAYVKSQVPILASMSLDAAVCKWLNDNNDRVQRCADSHSVALLDLQKRVAALEAK